MVSFIRIIAQVIRGRYFWCYRYETRRNSLCVVDVTNSVVEENVKENLEENVEEKLEVRETEQLNAQLESQGEFPVEKYPVQQDVVVDN